MKYETKYNRKKINETDSQNDTGKKSKDSNYQCQELKRTLK